jgi:hypothetical protein
MKHPFQVGDLVRSRMNRANIGIVLQVYTMDGRPYLDVKYLRGDVVRGGDVDRCVPLQRFTLISRAEG